VKVARQWRARSSPERLDLYIRASLYAALFPAGLLLLLGYFGAGQRSGAAGLALVLLYAAQAAVCVTLLHIAVSRYLRRGPRPKSWLVATAVALTAAGLLTGAAAFPRSPAAGFPPSLVAALAFGGTLTVALTPLLGRPALAAAVLAGAATASGLSAWMSGPGAAGPLLLGPFVLYVLIIAIYVLTCRSSAWMLRIMWELDYARTLQGRLSVAEERLRFARDLHDVLGQNLSLIAVQSELTAELARRGSDDVAAGMREVQRVAHESLREMRAVVSGYRAADLGTELAGAQAVLRSAGVSCRVIGDAAGLPPDVQATLAWVVREGTTNVIRHSDASICTIDLSGPAAPGPGGLVRLRMDNDRAHPPAAGADGSGLAGLGERLAGQGGSITAEYPRSGHFRLEATLPAGRAIQTNTPAS
jgi:two-component system sensor histidine kinase DesK